MCRRLYSLVGLLAIVVTAAACEATKSSNPLSPTVAGPIPGVNITAPNPVLPSGGAKIAVDQQPVALTVENAATNGVRPLNYLFEIATDTNFSNKVFSREGISPGTNGKTTLQLPDRLAPERTYYWRARAQDGANTGPYSGAQQFNVFTPIVLLAPLPAAPINNLKTETLQPTFSWANAPRSGPIGAITYVLELSDSAAFASKIAIWTVAEKPSQTTLLAPQELPASKQVFWHVRAQDPTTTGPWSTTQAFQTPAPAVVPPTPPPSGGGGGGGGAAAGDQINLHLASIYAAPSDIASWPVTETVTALQMSSSAGISMAFSPALPQRWKWFTGHGGDNYQYTVWACVQAPQWACSGFIQMWEGRPSTGAPILQQWNANWAYDGRWGPMSGYHPKVGDQMAFFVSAGNGRGQGTVTSVRERSNVVVVALPANDSGSFTFSLGSIPLP